MPMSALALLLVLNSEHFIIPMALIVMTINGLIGGYTRPQEFQTVEYFLVVGLFFLLHSLNGFVRDSISSGVDYCYMVFKLILLVWFLHPRF